MKYIIATDYDGTLYQYHKGGISKEVLDAIKEFRDRGNLFGVVTGRCYRWAYPIFKKEELFEFDYIISNGGAQCCDKDGNLVFSIKIETGVVEKLFDRVIKLGAEECGIALEKERYNFSSELEDGNGKEYSPFSTVSSCKGVASFHVVGQNPENAIEIEKALTDEFCNVINIARNDRCLDITAFGVNKATGIKKYADLMDVDKDNIYSAGDNFNDIPMVSAFHGCAVSNAVDALKDKAEYVCEDLAELIGIILSKEKENG